MRITKIARVASATLTGLLAVGASLFGVGVISPANAVDASPQALFEPAISPSFAHSQSFRMRFDQAVSDLTLDDFEVVGTALCQPSSVELSPNSQSANLDVSQCGLGTVSVTLKANSLQGANGTGPSMDVYSNKVLILDVPKINMPAATIVSSDEAELSVGDQFRIDFDMPIGEVVLADAVQVWGDAKCELGGTKLAEDKRSMSVWMSSCHDGEVGISLAPFAVTKDDGSCCGPQAIVKSNSLKIAHFGLPDIITINKGGPANPAPVADHVTGVVWFDLNDDHVQQDSEPGLAGATVALDNEQVLKTGSNGEYDFGSVAPGVHSVSLTLPWQLRVSEDSEGVEDAVVRIEVVAGSPAATWFAVVGNSFMAADFNDPEGNPLTEPVVVSWVGLDGINGTDDDVLFTAPTVGNGSYLLKNVPAGDYRVLMSGKQALTGEFTLAAAAYDTAGSASQQRDISVKYKDLAYTGGSPWNFGLLAFGLAALAGGWVMLRRSKLS
ncbi:MAG: hypothetical protein RLZZ626_1211 [Actinomycetota bacterium]